MWSSAHSHTEAAQRPLDFHRPADEIVADFPGRLAVEAGGACFAILSIRSGGVRSPYTAGRIIRSDNEVWIQAGIGHLIVDHLIDGEGAERPAPDFFREHKLSVGDVVSVADTTSRATRAA